MGQNDSCHPEKKNPPRWLADTTPVPKATQSQPQPPPQQLPPPPPEDVEDLVEAPLLEPFAVAKTESWIVAFLLAHLGQAISCCLLITMRSKRVSHLSQTYS